MVPPRFWFLTALTLVAAVSRIVPHPLNFAPFAAVALWITTLRARKAGYIAAWILVSAGFLLAPTSPP